MSDKLNRRQFVQTVAFFGAAMTLPASFKASALPKPESVIILPEDHPVVLAPETPLVWINKQPLTGAYRFRFVIEQELDMPFGYKFPTRAINKRTGRITITFSGDSFTALYDLIRLNHLEIAFAPMRNSSEAYICEVCSVSLFDHSMDKMNAAVIETEWAVMSEPRVVSVAELMQHLGISERARLILPAKRIR